MRGQRVSTTLVKSPRGFGFTIVGGSDRSKPQFLQIKNVVQGGPAAVDSILCTGDVLVYVNGVCVLGYTHADMVSMFQRIPVGDNLTLNVCKGYSLPFDPDDPDTEVSLGSESVVGLLIKKTYSWGIQDLHSFMISHSKNGWGNLKIMETS